MMSLSKERKERRLQSYDGMTMTRRGYNAAFFGHIHVPVLEKEDGILLVNPGSLAFPRQRGRRPSYAVLETDGNGGMDVEIRYL